MWNTYMTMACAVSDGSTKLKYCDERVWLTCCAPPRPQHVSISIRWTRFSARSSYPKYRSLRGGMVVRRSLPGRGSSRLVLENQ